MTTRLRLPIVLVVAIVSVACASSGSSSGRGVGNVLTYDDLFASNQTTVYLAIQTLRPAWLRTRGQTSVDAATVVTVFVDGTPRGNVSDLMSMFVTNVVDVTYFSASDAVFRFGTIAGSGGSIEINTRVRD
jgi:hypothetical protein